MSEVASRAVTDDPELLAWTIAPFTAPQTGDVTLDPENFDATKRISGGHGRIGSRDGA